MLSRKCALCNVCLVVFFFILIPVCNALPQEVAVLKMILNREDKGVFFFVLTPDEDVWMKKSEFDALGFKDGTGRVVLYGGEKYISFKETSGVKFRINEEEEVVLEVTADPDLFIEHEIDGSVDKRHNIVSGTDRSAFVNYMFMYDHRTEDDFFGASAELGVSSGDYFGRSTFLINKSASSEKALRLVTSLTYNDRDNMQKTVLGDFSALSGMMGPSVALGGINFSRNFSVAPYYIRFPALNMGGTIETPSDVEVYMDGLLVKRERISPGKFLFDDVPATVGLGTAEIVIKDAYGRERVISKPYYYSDHLLRKGLHEYSYSFGFIRKRFGVESFSYGPPVFTGFHNYGVSGRLKAGCSAELSEELIDFGPSLSMLLSTAGVIDASLIFSNAGGASGAGGLMHYSFQSRPFSINASLRMNTRKHSTLSMGPDDDKARSELDLAVGFGLKRAGALTAEWLIADMYEGQKRTMTAVSYTRAVSKRTTFYMTGSEIKDAGIYHEIFAGLHIYLDNNISGSMNYSRDESMESKKAAIQKSLPAGTGFGYRVNAEDNGGSEGFKGKIQYQNSRGVYAVGLSSDERDAGVGFSMSGGIGYIDNSFFFSRPIQDSFAKVKVGGLDDVRVYNFGNEVGRTDKDGELIVPGLRSFHNNRIEIESRDIPINYTIGSLQQYITPSFRSGSVVEFDVNKVQAVEGELYVLENGKEAPIELTIISVYINDETIEGLVGRHGDFYIENLPSGTYPAKTVYKGEECKFDMSIPVSDELMLNMGKIICEVDK